MSKNLAKIHPTDEQFFRAALKSAKRSQRELAAFLELDPSAVTHLFKGRRRMQLDEARKISQFIEKPISEVLAAAGLKVRETKGDLGQDPIPPQRIKVIASIDGDGVGAWVTNESVAAPSDLPSNAVAIRQKPDGGRRTPLTGAVLFFVARETIDPLAIGRLSWVHPTDGSWRLALVDRGIEPDEFTLIDLAGKERQASLLAASPILLIRP